MNSQNKPFWWPEPQALIALLLVVAMIALVFILALRKEPVQDSDLLKIVVGGLMTVGFSSIVNFYFGSSKESATKGDTLSRIATGEATPPPAAAPPITTTTTKADEVVTRTEPSGGTAATVAKALVAAVALSMLLMSGMPASAQSKLRLPIDPLGLNAKIGGAGLTGDPLNDLIGALDAKLLPDLQYALKLATASGSKVTAPCYQAWIDIINVRQKAVEDAQGQPLPMPDPAVITKFEKLVELRNSLQPDSDFMIKCSPVASMVKKDIIGFIGQVLAGGAGLAAMGL